MLRSILLVLAFGSAASQWLINNESKSWTLSNSPKAYDNCATYDICDVTYAVDGSADDLEGKSFVFETTDWTGSTIGPYNITIEMGAKVSLSQYRFYSKSIYTSRVKTMSLQYSTNGGDSFADVAGSELDIPDSTNPAGWFNASFSATPYASVWRVFISDAWPTGSTPQLYFTEVQFFEASEAEPTNSPTAGPTAKPTDAPTRNPTADKNICDPTSSSVNVCDECAKDYINTQGSCDECVAENCAICDPDNFNGCLNTCDTCCATYIDDCAECVQEECR